MSKQGRQRVRELERQLRRDTPEVKNKLANSIERIVSDQASPRGEKQAPKPPTFRAEIERTETLDMGDGIVGIVHIFRMLGESGAAKGQYLAAPTFNPATGETLQDFVRIASIPQPIGRQSPGILVPDRTGLIVPGK
jgi:hypothetical protein